MKQISIIFKNSMFYSYLFLSSHMFLGWTYSINWSDTHLSLSTNWLGHMTFKNLVEIELSAKDKSFLWKNSKLYNMLYSASEHYLKYLSGKTVLGVSCRLNWIYQYSFKPRLGFLPFWFLIEEFKTSKYAIFDLREQVDVDQWQKKKPDNCWNFHKLFCFYHGPFDKIFCSLTNPLHSLC